MCNKVILLFLMSTIFIACFSSDRVLGDSMCDFPLVKSVKTNSLENNIIGKWEYQYSIKTDSCFTRTNIKVIPEWLEYYSCSGFSDVNLKKKLPKIYALLEKNGFKDLCSKHYIPNAVENLETYPFYRKETGQKNEINLLHYVGNESSIGKKLMYNLNTLENDTLIISDNQSSSYDNNLKRDTYHYFLRTK